MAKSPDAFRTISEVAEWLGIQAHVLRFWESKFSQVKPVKRAGGRRYYRPSDMLLIGGIKKLLHEDGFTIKGVQKILREEGMSHVAQMSPPLDDVTLKETVAEELEAQAAQQETPVADTLPADDTPAEQELPFVSAEPDAIADEPAPLHAETPAAPEPFFARSAPASVPEPSEPAPALAPDMDGSPAVVEPSVPVEPVAETHAAPPPARPRIADIPPFTAEADFPATTGVLTALQQIKHMDGQDRAQIAPLMTRLAALRDRMAAPDGGTVPQQP
jgi:DNA-binding transcriptional MerR regulator